jgi:hypothetical protein
MNTVKRNSNNEMTVDGYGVGARHGSIASPMVQGGYPDICTTNKFSKKNPPGADSRLAELREIGLASHWIEVAQTIGVDNFLATWAILSNSDAVQDEKHYAYVPRYSLWLRYQRNRVILSLSADGLSTREICVRIKQDLNETVTIGHIRRVIADHRKRVPAIVPVIMLAEMGDHRQHGSQP